MTDIPKSLLSIWEKQCKDGDYVILSSKNVQSNAWKDRAIPYKSKEQVREDVEKFLENFPTEKNDLYFCPLPFDKPARHKDSMRGSKFLWSDMDEVNPRTMDGQLAPTYFWMSSPQRWQGLWEMDRFMKPSDAESLNKRLTYKIGADKGGWDLTQVLRIPGTINHKYSNKPKVGEISSPSSRNNKKIFQMDDLEEILTGKPVEKEQPQEELNPLKILAKYKKIIPREVVTKLTTSHAEVGKRSDMIWYLEHKLREVGVKPNEIYALIKNSAWNKYRGRADEDERLRTELTKILSKEMEEPDEPTDQEISDAGLGLVIESYQDVMSNLNAVPGWLVEGFWMKRSHGIVAGEPKSFKSVLTLDLAVSVASGYPFLGQYPVNETGPVIIVQNENSDWIMKDRLEKIITAKGLGGKMKVKGGRLVGKFPPDLPIYFINQQGFLVGDKIHREVVEQLAAEIKPVLIMFDPLYLMFEGDVNSAKDLNPVLNWMLYLKNEYNTGIVLIHHWNKSGGGKKGPVRGGQRMLGSTTLHGWIESAWYIGIIGEQGEDDPDSEVTKAVGKPVGIVIDREFRAGGTRPKIEAAIKMAEVGTPKYEVFISKHVGRASPQADDALKFHIINCLEANTGFVSARKLSEETGVGRKAINRMLEIMEETDEIIRTSKGVRLREVKGQEKR